MESTADIKTAARTGRITVRRMPGVGDYVSAHPVAHTSPPPSVPGHTAYIGGARIDCLYIRSGGGPQFDQYQWTINTRAVPEAEIERWIERCVPKFEIVEGDGGQKFRVWRDGRIEPHR